MANVYVRQKTISGSMTAEEQHAANLSDWSCGRWHEETLLRCSSSSGWNTLPLSTAFACSVAALSSPSARHSLPQLAFQATQGSHHSDRAASKTSKTIVSSVCIWPVEENDSLPPSLKFLCGRGCFSPCVGTWQQPSGVGNSMFSRVVVSLCGRNKEKVNGGCVKSHPTFYLHLKDKRSRGVMGLFVFFSSRGFLSDNCNARGVTARCRHFAL